MNISKPAAFGLLLLCLQVTQSKAQSSTPRFFDLVLCGVRLDLGQREFEKYDRHNKYYLLTENKFNHSYVGLALMKNPEVGEGKKSPIKLSLRTGKGVSIGDTPTQLQRKLGAPTEISSEVDFDDDGRKDTIYSYQTTIQMKWPKSRSSRLRRYTGMYYFSRNKLFQIVYLVQPPNGQTEG